MKHRNLQFAAERFEFGMKEIVELDLGLLTVIVGRVDGGDPSDASRVKLIFIPLMIGNVEFEIFHDALDGGESTDLARTSVREDAMIKKVD